MTRRNFLRNLGLAAAALGVPVAACYRSQRIKAVYDGMPPYSRENLYRARFGLDDDPPRFNLIDGIFVRVRPTDMIGAPNPAWADAEPLPFVIITES